MSAILLNSYSFHIQKQRKPQHLPRTQWISLGAATLDVSHPSARSVVKMGIIFPNCSRWKWQHIFELPPTIWLSFFDMLFLTSKWSYESYSNVFRIFLFTHVVTSFFGIRTFYDLDTSKIGMHLLYCWDLLSWTLKHQKKNRMHQQPSFDPPF